MKVKIFAVILGLTVLFIGLPWYARGVPPTPDDPLVVVGSFPNTPAEAEKTGGRIQAIFKAHQIECGGFAGSAGLSVDVPASQADKARQLLAHAVLEEGLAITLYGPLQGDRYVTVTPEAVLGLPSKR